MDFAEAFWLAIPAVLGEEVEIQGCTFHWTQAVFRHAKHLGLQSAYQKDEATRIFIENILALPHLPAEHILPMWEKLHRQASEFPASPLKTNLLGLLDYVNNNWINTDGAWKPKNWSAFLQLVRTNNNVEGWHNMLNIRANKIGMGLYRILYHLFTHTKDVSLQARLVTNHKVIKYQRRRVGEQQRAAESPI